MMAVYTQDSQYSSPIKEWVWLSTGMELSTTSQSMSVSFNMTNDDSSYPISHLTRSLVALWLINNNYISFHLFTYLRNDCPEFSPGGARTRLDLLTRASSSISILCISSFDLFWSPKLQNRIQEEKISRIYEKQD